MFATAVPRTRPANRNMLNNLDGSFIAQIKKSGHKVTEEDFFEYWHAVLGMAEKAVN